MVNKPLGFKWSPLPLDEETEEHIVVGHPGNRGGHFWGLFWPGKTEFRKDFTIEELREATYLIQRYGHLVELTEQKIRIQGIYKNQLITVICSLKEARIVTVYPLRGDGVVVNKNRKRKPQDLRKDDKKMFGLRYE